MVSGDGLAKFEIYGRLDFGIRSIEVLRVSVFTSSASVFERQKVSGKVRSSEIGFAVDQNFVVSRKWEFGFGFRWAVSV